MGRHGVRSNLTPRELEIIRNIVNGHTRLEVASTLRISKNTVDTYLRRVYQRLGTHTIVETVVYLMRNGVL